MTISFVFVVSSSFKNEHYQEEKYKDMYKTVTHYKTNVNQGKPIELSLNLRVAK